MALSGTSMATPLVAGATALVWSWMGRSFVSDLEPRIAPADLCASCGLKSRNTAALKKPGWVSDYVKGS